MADEELCRMITEKFRSVGGGNVSFADIAKRSWEVGRPGLATKVSFKQRCWCDLSEVFLIISSFLSYSTMKRMPPIRYHYY